MAAPVSNHRVRDPSRLAVWRALETKIDRYASWGAFAIGLGVFAAVVALL